MQKLLYVLCLLITNAFAVGTLTTIENGVTIHSEYYPNPSAKFKGTIIFENGSGMTTDEWTQNKQFLSCAKRYGSLFMYDRNGLGKSPADLNTSTSNPITAKNVNSKFLKLLKLKKIKPPYIIVGASLGGLYVDYFARKYPNLINSVLMVDPQAFNTDYTDKILRLFNVESWSNVPSKEIYSKYSYQNAMKYHMDTTAAVYYQYLGLEQSKQQINELPPLPENIPIIVISSRQMEKAENKLVKGSLIEPQKSYLNKNKNSKFIMTDSGHNVQIENPQLVCDQIKFLVSN